VAALIFLGIGLLCALIGRIMLIGAAFSVSVWWGLGVCLPFGPLFFRLNYPDLAYASRMFRLATLPCLLFYLFLGPGLTQPISYRHKTRQNHSPSQVATGYAMEAPNRIAKRDKSSGPQVVLKPSVEERMAANAAEFERLRAWSEKLRLQKRDLLHSDSEGNRAYSLELAKYNAALEKATAEKNSLVNGK